MNALARHAATLVDLGRCEKAREQVAAGRALAREDDIGDQIMLDVAEALARAYQGDSTRARTLMDRAIARAAGIDLFVVDVALGEAEVALLVAEDDPAAAPPGWTS